MVTKLVNTYGEKKTSLLKDLTAQSQLEKIMLAEITILVTLIQNYDFCTNTTNLKGCLSIYQPGDNRNSS